MLELLCDRERVVALGKCIAMSHTQTSHGNAQKANSVAPVDMLRFLMLSLTDINMAFLSDITGLPSKSAKVIDRHS